MTAVRDEMAAISASMDPTSRQHHLRAGDFVSARMMGQWLIDSGYSNHYTSTKHILSDYTDIKPLQILTGKGHVLAQGLGSVTLHTSLGTRRLNDVMWVPNLAGTNNLLSIPQLVHKGCDITIRDQVCVITDRKS